MVEYSLYDVADAVRKRVAKNPDFVYKPGHYPNCMISCIYTESSGEPSCLIGRGLADVGDPVPAWDANRIYGSRARETNRFGQGAWEDYYPNLSENEEKVAFWLRQVQIHQDRELPWARCIFSADATHPYPPR